MRTLRIVDLYNERLNLCGGERVRPWLVRNLSLPLLREANHSVYRGSKKVKGDGRKSKKKKKKKVLVKKKELVVRC